MQNYLHILQVKKLLYIRKILQILCFAKFFIELIMRKFILVENDYFKWTDSHNNKTHEKHPKKTIFDFKSTYVRSVNGICIVN